jgi:hypothetical protein
VLLSLDIGWVLMKASLFKGEKQAETPCSAKKMTASSLLLLYYAQA